MARVAHPPRKDQMHDVLRRTSPGFAIGTRGPAVAAHESCCDGNGINPQRKLRLHHTHGKLDVLAGR
jgi:hypothetical protein